MIVTLKHLAALKSSALTNLLLPVPRRSRVKCLFWCSQSPAFDLLWFSFFRSDNRSFADCTYAGIQLPVCMLVLYQFVHIGFVDFEIPFIRSLSFAKSLLILYSINQAYFCVMPKSRCSFMLDTPLKIVAIKYIAIAHFRRKILESPRIVPCLSEKYWRQSRHRWGSGFLLFTSYVFVPPQRWQTAMPFFQGIDSNHLPAESLSGYISNSSTRDIRSLNDFPDDFVFDSLVCL